MNWPRHRRGMRRCFLFSAVECRACLCVGTRISADFRHIQLCKLLGIGVEVQNCHISTDRFSYAPRIPEIVTERLPWT